jgi:hypothetical protein
MMKKPTGLTHTRFTFGMEGQNLKFVMIALSLLGRGCGEEGGGRDGGMMRTAG